MRWLFALGTGLALSGAVSAYAADYAEQIALRPAHIYEKDGRPRIVLEVNNNSGDVLDIVVACDFLDAASNKIGTGHGTVSRLPPRRSDTIEVVDEVAQRADTARCNVIKVEK